MPRRKSFIFIYALIGLAILGFATQLLTNTISLLTSLLLMVAVGAIIYGAVYYFYLRKRTSNELKKYSKAVKQSKAKYQKDDKKKTLAQTAKKHSPLGTKKRANKNRASHLRVIDGNKDKRKNRASL